MNKNLDQHIQDPDYFPNTTQRELNSAWSRTVGLKCSKCNHGLVAHFFDRKLKIFRCEAHAKNKEYAWCCACKVKKLL